MKIFHFSSKSNIGWCNSLDDLTIAIPMAYDLNLCQVYIPTKFIIIIIIIRTIYSNFILTILYITGGPG
jgi:hypothetical protein